MADAPQSIVYGSPKHAAREALIQSGITGFNSETLANIVIDGLQERGFVVGKEPRCDCGWIVGNHQHDARLGKKG